MSTREEVAAAMTLQKWTRSVLANKKYILQNRPECFRQQERQCDLCPDCDCSYAPAVNSINRCIPKSKLTNTELRPISPQPPRLHLSNNKSRGLFFLTAWATIRGIKFLQSGIEVPVLGTHESYFSNLSFLVFGVSDDQVAPAFIPDQALLIELTHLTWSTLTLTWTTWQSTLYFQTRILNDLHFSMKGIC